jgi:prevent-host-death family protein
MKTVGLRELKNRLAEYIRDVRSGESVVVTDRGEIVAELTPPGHGPGHAGVPASLAALARRGLVTIGARGDRSLYPRLPRARRRRHTAAQLLRLPFPSKPIRTLDAIHLASVLVARPAVAGLELLSFDDRIRKAAITLGVRVHPAESCPGRAICRAAQGAGLIRGAGDHASAASLRPSSPVPWRRK